MKLFEATISIDAKWPAVDRKAGPFAAKFSFWGIPIPRCSTNNHTTTSGQYLAKRGLEGRLRCLNSAKVSLLKSHGERSPKHFRIGKNHPLSVPSFSPLRSSNVSGLEKNRHLSHHEQDPDKSAQSYNIIAALNKSITSQLKPQDIMLADTVGKVSRSSPSRRRVH